MFQKKEKVSPQYKILIKILLKNPTIKYNQLVLGKEKLMIHF